MNRLFGTLILCLAAGATASAGIIYSTGFENPPFTTGPISGQDGWATFGPSAASQVESGVAQSGTQALSVLPALSSGQTGAFIPVSTSATIVELSAFIMLDASSTQSGWQFGATGPAGVGFLGGVDTSTTGQIQLISAGFPVVATVTYNTWQLYDFVFNLNTQTYTFSLDGTLIGSNVPFCGNNSGPCSGANIPAFGEGLFDTFPAAGANDIGFIDNLTIASVPEPGSFLLLGVGLLGLVAWAFARSDSFSRRQL
jgi:hypothetical protein